MIYFFTPYSFEKKLFEAYDHYVGLVNNTEDWVCMCDGDAAFLLSDFGHQIQEYVKKYPDTGMFTCYASRCPYGHQMKAGVNYQSDSIQYIFSNTERLRREDHLKVRDIQKRIAGHLMVIKKATWIKYREEIREHAAAANIQAVDTAISDVMLKHKEKILLMEGMQVFHYYRQYSMSEKHILSNKLTVVIRTHDRPKAFKRCIDSVMAQTHKNIDVVVGVDTPGSLSYVEKMKAEFLRLKEDRIKIIKCKPRERMSQTDFPANGYVSELIEGITDGYILVLDDDNFISDPKGVEKLFREIDKEWCIYIIRYRYPDGRLFPNDQLFRSKIVKEGGIDWASCVFHARFANVVKSKPIYNADYHFINSLVNYAKTTKWVDLDLVHTDTPGNNGRTENGERRQENGGRKKGKYDVVYVLGKGSNWADNEIRISIRSMVKYFKDLRDVVVVGERPSFLDGIVHIPCEDRQGVNKDARMMLKIMEACKDPRVSDDFVLCLDDEVLLSPVKFKDITGWHLGPIRRQEDGDRRTESGWIGYVMATGEELRKRGLPDNNYDSAHCPQPVNKAEFIEVMSGWDMIGNQYTVSNIYNNSSKLFTGKNIEGKNAKIYSPVDCMYDTLLKPLVCMNYNDKGLELLKFWLFQRFPDTSPYERFLTGDDKRTAVQKWFADGCDYDHGVRIFEQHARNRILLRFFQRKRGSNVAVHKLKNTLQLWMR